MKYNYLAAGFGALALVATSSATTYTWNFNNPSGAISGPHNYLDTTSAYALTATGFKTQHSVASSAVLGKTWGHGASFDYNTGDVTANKLYGKTSSADETGLGLDGLSSDHEITGNSFVQLDTKNLKDHHLVNLKLNIASVQNGEGFFLWGSNVANTPGTLLKIGRNPANGGTIQSFIVPDYNDYRYFSVSADGGDVLIQNGVTAQAVPEPMSMLVLGGGLAAFLRKRKS